jgi:hypothetical protein
VDEIGEIVAGKFASAPLLKLSLQLREFSIQVSFIRKASKFSESTTLGLGQVGPNHVSAPSAQRTAVKQRPHQETTSYQQATSEPMVLHHGREVGGVAHDEVRRASTAC